MIVKRTLNITSKLPFLIGAGSVVALSILGQATAHAAPANDHNADDAFLCVHATSRYEKEFGIPKHLLQAISITESGKWHKNLRRIMPWPWTVSLSGKAHYFSSSQETANFIKKMIRAGHDNIDVGCNQINVRYHRNNFDKVEHMVDPQMNTAYAAAFLKKKYDEKYNWNHAVSHYHSATAHLGSKYLAKVYNAWNQTKQHNAAPTIQRAVHSSSHHNLKSTNLLHSKTSVRRNMSEQRRRSNMMVYYSGSRDTSNFDNSRQVAALSQKVLNQ